MKTDVSMLFLIVSIVTIVEANSIPDDHEVDSCQAVRLLECRQFNYSTIFPNDNDIDIFHRMSEVFNSGCSEFSVQLACYVLEPSCQSHSFNDTNMFIFVAHICKEFCLYVKEECREHESSWQLDCDSLPSHTPGASKLCFSPDVVFTDAPPIPELTNSSNASTLTPPEATQAPLSCPGKLVPYEGKSFGSVEDCTAPCHYYYEEDELSPDVITGLFVIWSILTLLSAISVVSFILTWKHYSHIEYPYYSAYLCHALFIVAFLFRAVVGHDNVVCDSKQSTNNDTALYTGKFGNGWCVVTFIFTYYTTLAIGIWFVNMTIALCTLKFFKWRYHLHAVYHLAGWGIPIIFVGLASFLKLMSGDNLLGMCQLDPEYTLVTLILPLFVCLGIGFVLLFTSIIQMFYCSRAGREVQNRHPHMVGRSILFATILLIEIAILVVLHLIEHIKHKDWEIYYTDCVIRSSPDCSTRSFTRPTYVIPIMRYSLISFVGAVSIICPLSRKVTWLSWKESLQLLYKKIVDLFSSCSWRRKTVVIAQLVSCKLM